MCCTQVRAHTCAYTCISLSFWPSPTHSPIPSLPLAHLYQCTPSLTGLQYLRSLWHVLGTGHLPMVEWPLCSDSGLISPWSGAAHCPPGPFRVLSSDSRHAPSLSPGHLLLTGNLFSWVKVPALEEKPEPEPRSVAWRKNLRVRCDAKCRVELRFQESGEVAGTVDGVSSSHSWRAELAQPALEAHLPIPVSSLSTELGIKSWLEVDFVVLSRGFHWVYFELSLAETQQRF